MKFFLTLGFNVFIAVYVYYGSEPRVPSAPRNVTKSATTIHDGLIDVTISWMEPAKYDLPIGKYKVGRVTCARWRDQ